MRVLAGLALLPLLVLDPGAAVAGGEEPPAFGPLDARLLGGSKYDAPSGLAVGPDGCPVVAGTTCSRDLPVRRPLQVRWAESLDGFVTKLDPAGTRVLFCTYLGGSGWDEITDVAIGPDGDVYVCGFTYSEDFPVTPGSLGGPAGAPVCASFLARIDPRKARFVYSTLLGGNPLGRDAAVAVAVGPDGSAYVTGTVQAAAVGLGPAPDPRLGPGPATSVPWVGRVAPDGSRLLYAKAVGAPGPGTVMVDVAALPDGSAIAAGRTMSIDPVPPGGRPAGRVRHGIYPFAVRVDRAGEAATGIRLGPEGPQGGVTGVSADGAGGAWIVGSGTVGPGREGPFEYGAEPPEVDAFAFRVGPRGAVAGGPLPLSPDLEDQARVAAAGDGAWLLGRTGSPSFPGADPRERITEYGFRFLARLDSSARVLDSLVLPLPPVDLGGDVAVAPSGEVFVTGRFADPGVVGAAVGPSDGPEAAEKAASRPGPREFTFPRVEGVTGRAFLLRAGPLAGAGPPERAGDEEEGPWTLARLPGFRRGRAPVPSAGEGGAAAAGGAGEGEGGGAADAAGGAEGGPGEGAAGGGEGAGAGTAAAGEGILPVAGSLRDDDLPGKDRFSLRGRLEFPPEGGLPLAGFDPSQEGLRVTVGSRLYPLVVEIPAGDPGWQERGENLAWDSPAEAVIGVRVRIRREGGAFSLEFRGFDFPGPQENPVQVVLEGIGGGASLGRHEAHWSRRGRGVLRFP